ncbi:MAG TPA: hypothetical protein PK639_01350 [Candidatus Woesebacteria bacterium]|nr:hypothetical protein [Candidatus Woesebacteria bacterium]
MDYPKHLSEKIREEVAVSYLKHELRKVFPSIKTEEIEMLMQNKSLAIPRDFWNGVHGIGMGLKLHIGFIYLLTAENINWTKKKVGIDSLFFGVDRENTKLADSRSVKIIKDFYQKNKELEIMAKQKFLANWMGGEQENDPIIIIDKTEGLAVYEGNNRVEKAMFDGIEEIEAFVGRYTTETKKPLNYWLPTSLIMDNLFFVYQAIDDNNEVLFEQQMVVLKDMIKNSESGKIEFSERALTKKEKYREKILTKIPTEVGI